MSALTRPLSKDALHLVLKEELERLGDEETGRTARTLVKDGPLRVTLVSLSPGGHIATHRAAGPITVQPVAGSITFEVAGEKYELGPGEIMAVGAGVEHAVGSKAGGAFLLTVALPVARSDRGASEL